MEVKGLLELTVARKRTTLSCIFLVAIALMAYAVTGTTIIHLATVTQEHLSHQMKLKQAYIQKMERVHLFTSYAKNFIKFYQFYALLDYRSDKTLLGNNVAKRLNVEGS